MNKKRILVIIVIGVLIGFIAYNYPAYKKVKELNQGGYDWLNCSMECPLELSFVTGLTINEKCLDLCKEHLEVSEDISLEFMRENSDKLLVSSEKLKQCGGFIEEDKEKGLVKYRECVIGLLPELKRKYLL